MPLLFGLVFLAKTLGRLPIPIDIISYISYIACAIYMIKNSKGKMVTPALLFLAYLPLELMISTPDPLFKSKLRLGLFALMFMAVAPLFKGKELAVFRYKTFRVMMDGCMLIGTICFFCYFANINFMEAESLSNMRLNLGGTFSGICNHSMTLGAIAGYGAICAAYYFYTSKKKLYGLLFICCLGALMFASSRSAFMGCILGLVALIYKLSRNKGHFLKRILTIVFIAAISFPIWKSSMEGLTAKNDKNIEQGSVLSSRDRLWSARIEEFKSSPIVGIGFVAVDTKNHESYAPNGTIEPGTSWLAILSMTGVIGFILFLNIYCPALNATIRDTNMQGILLLGALVMMSVHMIAEGFIFSAGDFSCMFVWLILGCCYDIKLYK